MVGNPPTHRSACRSRPPFLRFSFPCLVFSDLQTPRGRFTSLYPPPWVQPGTCQLDSGLLKVARNLLQNISHSQTSQKLVAMDSLRQLGQPTWHFLDFGIDFGIILVVIFHNFVNIFPKGRKSLYYNKTNRIPMI